MSNVLSTEEQETILRHSGSIVSHLRCSDPVQDLSEVDWLLDDQVVLGIDLGRGPTHEELAQ